MTSTSYRLDTQLRDVIDGPAVGVSTHDTPGA